jgi:hypothetical protein
VIYQWKDGVRQPVDGSFVVADNHQVSFKLGAYDHSRELTIDPTLLFLGTLGTGNQQSVPNGMAVDVAGEIILTGITNDLTFPTTADALQPICTNSSAIFNANYHRCGPSSASSGFVTKISADGTELIYSTYLHGLSGQEYGEAVAADTSGDAYILGMTSSNNSDTLSACLCHHPSWRPDRKCVRELRRQLRRRRDRVCLPGSDSVYRQAGSNRLDFALQHVLRRHHSDLPCCARTRQLQQYLLRQLSPERRAGQ